MKKCPFCGRGNEDDAKTCIGCYAGLKEKKKPEENQEEIPEESEQKFVSRRKRS